MSRRRRDLQQVPRAIAGKVLRDLAIQSPDEIDVETIAAHFDCFVLDGGVSGADGRVLTSGGRSVIRVRSGISDVRHRRFVVAHEFGHVRLKHERLLSVCSESDIVSYSGGNAESEANAFAAELLLPSFLVRPLIKSRAPGFAMVEKLSETFRATFTASAIRLIDLSAEPCAVVWSHRGRIKWAVASDDFPGFIRQGAELSPFTNAAGAFRGEVLPKQAEMVPSDAWIDGFDVPEEILEESRWFRNLQVCFSLLRLP